MTMFTKKHYDLLAEMIGSNLTLEEFYMQLLTYMANDNPQFDERRFVSKCADWRMIRFLKEKKIGG